MDERTYRALREVGRSIPKELLRDAIIKSEPLKGGVDEYLKWQKDTTRFSSRDDRKKVEEIKKYQAKGAFDHESTTIDPVKEKKIEDFVEGRVKHLIDSGQIKPTKLDPWARRISEKAKKKV